MRARYPDREGIVEDTVGWALEIDGETLAAAHNGLECCDAAATRRLAATVACPVLVLHGTDDAVRGYDEGEALARDPVRLNLLIKQFADGFRR
jgi:pimeloyl-ACP methyl ester carboxylesterase